MILNLTFPQRVEQQQALREAKETLQKDKEKLAAQLLSGQHEVISYSAYT